ncbi:glycosyltransferase [Microbacterium rhizosphaerae]|uniref:Glycosyltransferase n=1 Tax=Microbacterium rhizosphaerae TaxID=1678237 RepID=A0ABZ0SN74_9MICO|nr:glycosyltransferase [Microbacterium rhizosphaerae]WPR90822.1 glycosyltransferase [Microbacterium rhizosphaerae]
MTARSGAIALAAYQPDEQLFARQLRSLQAQTVEDWSCVISADGGREEVEAAVRRAVGRDDRFTVCGYDDRVGFYRNFERALREVEPSVAWVALSDQDDFWYPRKLERLIPFLEDHTIVSGQARVAEDGSGRTIAESTDRVAAELLDLTTLNRFSGAMSVFRREVLDLALPFPVMATPVEVHDHWIAVCAAVLGPTAIVDDVLQDYVQHAGNVLGEAGAPGRFRASSAWRTLAASSQRYQGSRSLRALVRTVYDMGYGWRALISTTLEARRQPGDAAVAQLSRIYGSHAKWGAAFAHFAAASGGASNTVMLDAGRLMNGMQRRRSLTARAEPGPR